MGTCKYHKVDQPIATVKTWGILTPDHEDNIEKVVRYIGPVAVGLIGADPAFLSYESGVFTSTKGKEGKCETSQADHGKWYIHSLIDLFFIHNCISFVAHS